MLSGSPFFFLRLFTVPNFFVRTSGSSASGTDGHLGLICTQGRALGLKTVGERGEKNIFLASSQTNLPPLPPSGFDTHPRLLPLT